MWSKVTLKAPLETLPGAYYMNDDDISYTSWMGSEAANVSHCQQKSALFLEDGRWSLINVASYEKALSRRESTLSFLA